MDRTWMARLTIVVAAAISVLGQSQAGDELLAVKNMMPRPHQERKIKEYVEKQLSALFGFSKKVVPRNTLHVPDHLWTMYRKWNGEVHDDTDKMTNVVRILHHDDSKLQFGKESILFNLNDFPNNEKIRKVELHVFKTAKDSFRDGAKAYLHAHTHNKGTSRLRRSLVEERHINTSEPKWEKFDVTTVVQNWLDNRVKKHMFTIEVQNAKNGLTLPWEAMVLSKVEPSMVTVMDWERQRPFLVVESSIAGMKRERRAVRGNPRGRDSNRHSSRHRARKLHEKAKKEMCRRRPYYLDFESIGWHKQIVHPMGFDMYYCQGTCPKPLGPHMNTTNHAVIQNQMNSFDPSLVPPPCCVPSSLGDTNILYIDMGNQIVMKTYSDTVVQGCGCR
eukprot:gene3070-1355_t